MMIPSLFLGGFEMGYHVRSIGGMIGFGEVVDVCPPLQYGPGRKRFITYSYILVVCPLYALSNQYSSEDSFHGIKE